MKKDIRKAIPHSVAWSFVDSFWQLMLSLGTVLVLSRLLKPSEFGLSALALTVVQMPALMLEGLFNDAIIQRNALEQKHVDTVFSVSLLIGVALTALYMLGAGTAAALFGQESLSPLITLTSLAFLTVGCTGVITATLRRDMRFKALAMQSFVARTGGTAAAIGIALVGHGMWAMSVQLLVSSVLGLIVVGWQVHRHPRFRISIAALCDMANFSVMSTMANLVWTNIFRAFLILIGYFQGVTEVGYVHLTFRIIDVVKMSLTMAATNVALPILARHQDDRETLRGIYGTATALSCTVTLPAMAALFAFAPELVLGFFGEQWAPLAFLIRCMTFPLLVIVIGLHAGSLLMAVGRPTDSLIWAIACFACMVACVLIFGRSDIDTLVLAFAVVFGLSMSPTFWMVRRATGLTTRDYLRYLNGPLVAAAAMMATLMVLKPFVLPLAGPYATVALVSGVGFAVYLALLTVLSPELLRQLIGGVRLIALTGRARNET